MNGAIAFLRSSSLVKILGVALLALLGFNLVDSGKGMLVLWALIAAAITASVLWGVRATTGAARLASATLASYAVGVAWLVYEWPSPFLVWAVITALLVKACIASARSESVAPGAVCIVMAITMPYALVVSWLQQTWSNDWTLF